MTAVAHIPAEPSEPRRSALATTTPADLLRIAIDKGADLERLEKLMDLQTRWEAQESRKAYVAAMTAFKAEPMTIFKKKTVSFTTRDGDTTSYSHAELSDITEVVGPAMAKHGLSHRWDVRQENGGVTVDCIITHALGHSEKVTMFAAPDASGKKNAIQQIASATTYLMRYTLLAATGMSTKGMDDDGRKAETEVTMLTEDHQATITTKCEGISKTMLRTVLKNYSVEKLEQIPDDEYKRIIDRLDLTEKERAAKGAAQ